MARFKGPPWGIICCTEAAGNSATLSALTVLPPLRGEFTASTNTFEFSKDIWINGYYCFGDVANITQVTVGGSEQAGGRYYIDSRENQPAETSTASASGWTDLRNNPIRINKGDIPAVTWAEDASTNVEPCLNLIYSLERPLPMEPMYTGHNRIPASAFDETLAQTSTTAVTWTRGTNIFGPSNGSAKPVSEEYNYLITAMRSAGSATLKAGVIEMEGLPALPGISGAVDPNVSQIPPVNLFEVSPVLCTGSELNKLQVITADVAGSETPTYVLTIRRL